MKMPVSLRRLAVAASLALAAAASVPAAAQEPAAPPADTAKHSRSEMVTEVLAHLEAAGVRERTGRIEMEVRDDRRLGPVRLAGADLPDEVLPGIVEIVDRHLSLEASPGHYLISFPLDQAPSLWAARPDPGKDCRDVEQRLPRISNSRHMRELLGLVSRVYAGDRVEPVLLLRIDRTGAVGYVEVRPTGIEELDRLLIPYAFEFRFHPAALDGEPVAVWAYQPVTFGS